MKIGLRLITVLFLGLLISCGGEEAGKDDKTNSEDVKEEISEAADVAKEYAADEYDEILNDFEEFTAETDGKILNMQNDADAMGDDVKERYIEILGDIKNKNKDIKKKLENFKEAGKEEKKEIEAEINALRNDIKASIETFEKKREEDQ